MLLSQLTLHLHLLLLTLLHLHLLLLTLLHLHLLIRSNLLYKYAKKPTSCRLFCYPFLT
jgi:hypothetical protein